MFSNKGYNMAKAIALVWLPALGTLYWTLSAIWNLPHTEQVIGSITAVDTFLGAVLHLSTKAYTANPQYDGQVIVDNRDPANSAARMTIDTPADQLAGKSQLVLQVKNAPLVLETPPPPAA